MKILKKPENIIYDTNIIDHTYRNPRENYGYPIPLHHTHNMTDFEFLRQYFNENHKIFTNFSQSFYYKLSPQT